MRIILKIIFCLSVFASCRPSKCDENVPSIGFVAFQQYRNDSGLMLDTAKIIISFKDCDGDIGLEDEDTMPPYEVSGKYYYNLVMQYFEMNNGTWEACPVNVCSFRWRIPKLESEGQSKILEGKIYWTIAPYYYNKNSVNSDTIKYSAQLYDRSLNESNIIETPMILTK